jgi:hypothetical protein
MHGSFKPPHPELGDPNTIGGYSAVHGRPAAFEGSDGFAYSVELSTEATGVSQRPFGAFILFLRWSAGSDPRVTGHFETPFLEFAGSAEAARLQLGRMSLARVREILEELIDPASGPDAAAARGADGDESE